MRSVVKSVSVELCACLVVYIDRRRNYVHALEVYVDSRWNCVRA